MAPSRNHFCSVCVYVCVCVWVCSRASANACANVDLLIQFATRPVLSSAASLPPLDFSTVSHIKDKIFGKKKVSERKMCVLIFYTTFI